MQASSAPVRVRFAPSPTGYLHVGGLRTALFNHLFARHSGGVWVLRIEDTDQSRYVPGSVEALQDTLAWAGLDYDEGPGKEGLYGPYRQSERLPKYRAYAKRLLGAGRAYCDFRAQKKNPDVTAARSSALLRDAYLPSTDEETQARIARGEPYVVRLRMDPERTFSYIDGVFGQMNFRPDAVAGRTDDPILLKSDGWPTYHLASVVDDSEMRISHVLRGEEWLPSMPKHLALYEAIGAAPPQFVHLPLLVNADGSKLSKRSGDVRVEDYRTRGVEPETLVNLCALTGYNHQPNGADTTSSDVMFMDQLAAQFSLARISHSRATLPMDKLSFLNRRHIAQKLHDAMQQPGGKAHTAMLARLRPLFAEALGVSAADWPDTYILQAAGLGCERVDTLAEIPTQMDYLFHESAWDANECVKFRASIPDESFAAVLTKARDFFDAMRSDEPIHAQLQEWMQDLAPCVDGGRAAIQKSLRIALTGRRVGIMYEH
ncbi:Mse1p [Malassezia vespertilionis]|uniref:glutamate--tRNA ligase n=1 Tax=Malassezia vespertilionis TaxID=2020962 RepID=A0A2N1JGP6_9BASI|nr:Mse1p [Malassezia vespertilionis]